VANCARADQDRGGLQLVDCGNRPRPRGDRAAAIEARCDACAGAARRKAARNRLNSLALQPDARGKLADGAAITRARLPRGEVRDAAVPVEPAM